MAFWCILVLFLQTAVI